MSTISFIVRTRVPGDEALLADGTVGCLSDTKNLKNPPIAFMVKADGNVAINKTPLGGSSVVIPVTEGTIYPFEVTRFFSTSTTLTAAQIVLLYGPLHLERVMILGVGNGLPFLKTPQKAASSLWTPASETPLFWVDIPVARSAGRIYTTSTKVTAASALSDPIGAIVQEGSLGKDLIQATSSRRYYLDQLADGQWAAASDNVDDGLFTSSIAFASSSKIVGFRAEYHTLPVGSELDIFLQVGGSAASTRISMGGPSYAYPGLIFSLDNTGAGSSQIRYASFSPTVGVPFTVIVAYNGGQINIKTNYRLWIDGVEIPNASLTGGPSAGGVASSTLMNFQSASNLPPGAKMSKVFALNSDLGLVASGDQALIDPMQAYLVL